ncbi:hypothetical protein Droror1_Dr00010840 [Drosera rotundifolia]
MINSLSVALQESYHRPSLPTHVRSLSGSMRCKNDVPQLPKTSLSNSIVIREISICPRQKKLYQVLILSITQKKDPNMISVPPCLDNKSMAQCFQVQAMQTTDQYQTLMSPNLTFCF